MRRKREGLRAEREATRFIAQRETGPWSEAEEHEFNRWLSASTLHRVAFYRLNAAWQEAGRLKALQAGVERAASRPFQMSGSGERSAREWYPRAIAAGVLLALAGVLGLLSQSLFHRNTYRTDIGGLQAIQMADGSRVTLNTDSRMDIHVGEHERRVDLEQGEAFFDVARDPKRAFVVNVGDRRVVAVGTQFSVRREADDIRVSVTEGAVRVEPGRQSGPAAHAVLLHAGTTARTEGGSVMVQEKQVGDLEQHLTWRNGVLTFHHTPLAEAVEEINRYNERKIVIRDPGVASIQVGGVFVANRLDPFLHLLESGFPVSVTHEGDRIVIGSKPGE